MANEENLKPAWKKGESGNPKGRPKGSKNRSTIAKKWLEVTEKTKNPITGQIEELTQEDKMTLAMLRKSINGSESAYEKLMYSAYGHHVQQIEQTVTEQPLFPDVQEDDCNK